MKTTALLLGVAFLALSVMSADARTTCRHYCDKFGCYTICDDD